jgi:hypothetical protein
MPYYASITPRLDIFHDCLDSSPQIFKSVDFYAFKNLGAFPPFLLVLCSGGDKIVACTTLSPFPVCLRHFYQRFREHVLDCAGYRGEGCRDYRKGASRHQGYCLRRWRGVRVQLSNSIDWHSLTSFTIRVYVITSVITRLRPDYLRHGPSDGHAVTVRSGATAKRSSKTPNQTLGAQRPALINLFDKPRLTPSTQYHNFQRPSHRSFSKHQVKWVHVGNNDIFDRRRH